MPHLGMQEEVVMCIIINIIRCAANLKRFWCEYTCSPRQAEFLTLHGYDNIRDPIDPTKQI